MVISNGLTARMGCFEAGDTEARTGRVVGTFESFDAAVTRVNIIQQREAAQALEAEAV